MVEEGNGTDAPTNPRHRIDTALFYAAATYAIPIHRA